jgi:phosphoglycerate dehydrogenase-like enzyme
MMQRALRPAACGKTEFMNIAVLDDYLSVSQRFADWSRIHARADVTVFTRPLRVPDEAASTLAKFDILCTLRERMPIPRALIECLPRLKYIVVTGKRYDTVDVAAAAERGILVSNTPVTGSGSGAVVELTWGLILALARHIASEDRLMRSGGWQHQTGITLKGRKLGVVGLGGLGQGVARIGAAFGMEVVAWSPNMTDERAAAAGARHVTKEELFATSDVITLHLALAESTVGVVGAPELARMKPTAYLVNTARGALVDEGALVETLRAGRIAGAGLDVYATEPLPLDHPLRGLSNVVLTPHLGYFTQEMLTTYYSDAIAAIEAYLDGTPIRVVNLPQNA